MNAIDVAYWLFKNGVNEDTFWGNVKMQKMLYFAQLLHLARFEIPLFNDNINAFDHGCVVESVRKQYKAQKAFRANANRSVFLLNGDELITLETTIKMFGMATGKELEDINHTHESWIRHYENANKIAYKQEDDSIIPLSDLKEEALKMKKSLKYIENTIQTTPEGVKYFKINNVKIYFDPEEVLLTEDIIDMLYQQSFDESAYELYQDEHRGLLLVE